jgi:hypothetical protein
MSFSAYVVQLHNDPAELQRFKDDPDACIADAGLSQEQGDALKSGDQDAIQAQLDAEAGGGSQPMGLIELESLMDKFND